MNRFVGAVLQRHLVSYFVKAPMNVPTLLHRLGLSPLPVAAKIDRGRTPHRESGETAHLLPRSLDAKRAVLRAQGAAKHGVCRESAGGHGLTGSRTPGQLVDAALSGELAGGAKEVVQDVLHTGDEAVRREASAPADTQPTSSPGAAASSQSPKQ